MRRKLALWGLLALLLGVGSSQGALADPRQAVRAAYDKASLGAELKFLDGMLSLRAPGFVAFAPDERKLDLSAERVWLRSLLGRSLTVKLTTEISSFQQLDARNARCAAHETMECQVVDPKTREPLTLTLVTRSEDRWILTRRGWKQKECHVREQTMQKTPGTTAQAEARP